MLEMKLPMSAAGEGDDTAEDGQERTGLPIPGAAAPPAPHRAHGCPAGDGLSKEAVFEWFGLHLKPAKRIEFMYGLLHMCQPLELRFLGSCLEDLARKDYYVLRDFETRANSPSDLSLLADVIDQFVRARLLVYLSLLGSDNRECAGIIYRVLNSADPALLWKSCGLAEPRCEDAAGPGAELLEQLALLFTMASLHPAFPFHQRETLRGQLEKAELALQQRSRQENKHLYQVNEGSGSERSHAYHAAQSPHHRRVPREAVHIEKIVLKGISRSRTDREYSFEVKWSDSTLSSVTKTHLELKNFLLELPKEQSTESFEKGILRLLNQAEKYENRDVERTLKEKFLFAPGSFRQTGKACSFFFTDSTSSPGPSCSKCNSVLIGKPFQEACSEASSQEEDLEPYVQGHRKKPGSKSPNLSIPNTRVSQVESRRPQHCAEHNGLPDWRRKSCVLKTTQEPCGQAAEQYQDERRSSSTKTKTRPAPPTREKGKKGEGRASYNTNGIAVLPQSLWGHQLEGKDVRPNVGSGQDTFGETSSESYSSPSSPQHDGRESLDSEDEKDKDTDSHSDDCYKVNTEPAVACKGVGASAVATVHPLIPAKLMGPENPLEFTVPYMVQNCPDVVAAAGVATLTTDCKVMMSIPVVLPNQGTVVAAEGPLESAGQMPTFGVQTPGSPALQPVVHRFKTAGPQVSTESGVVPTPAHLPPVGAISVNPAAPTYPSPVQPTYPSADPVAMGSMPMPDPHTKPAGLGLPSGLVPPYNLPIPTSVITHMGAPMASVGPQAVAASQVSAVVPTHTPGPAPSPSPALTHSTAQSDSTSYIHSSTCGSASIAQQQQQSAASQQQPIGCGACGCRGTCGGGGSHPPNYYFPQMHPRQVFQQMPHIFPLQSLCNSSYLSQGAAQSNGTNQLPFFPTATAPATYAGGAILHTHGHTHSDHVLGSQAASYASIQQMASFNRFYSPLYPTTVGVVPGSGCGRPGVALGGACGISKKNGNVSCYNCGGSGHYAQDCKQPAIDALQQGGFRLKYGSSHASEAQDNIE
ncbi:zinc finger CCHC domain-containing protein 2-like isoform X2 [Denticeps clupeoides]|uniref:CCHC-type domain-containing protein n=1 Tax=Denticeps clupeoides TaxID=299321 RepID=A0AAY4BIY4_9TELE|nr:zinc finger CCHC domain-containing protein 2 isoform X2 [Denticeps clupeoides]